MDLDGAHVLVTGASRGIGEATARAFAEAGGIVALAARSADAVERLAGELGGTAHAVDLADGVRVAGSSPPSRPHPDRSTCSSTTPGSSRAASRSRSTRPCGTA